MSLLTRERIEASDYDALVMDTLGSELLALKGAAPILHTFNFIKTEVTDFESYAGSCQLRDIDLFVKEHGFHEISRHRLESRAKGGSCYDIAYERKAAT
jgi:hypothetical protein